MIAILPIIIGIDPGSRITGYGVIQLKTTGYHYLSSGCILTKGDNLAVRLQQIYTGIRKIMHDYQPQETAIEQVFMAKNASSALKLGHARGVAMLALSDNDRQVNEYSARQIKQTVVGYGAADKAQVQQMVKRLLNINGTLQTDAADALAVAICHAHHRSLTKLLSKQQEELV